MLLRNHGTLTVGRSVASAFERMFHLERACTMQVRTRMLGPTAYPVEQAVIDKNTVLFGNPERAGDIPDPGRVITVLGKMLCGRFDDAAALSLGSRTRRRLALVERRCGAIAGDARHGDR